VSRSARFSDEKKSTTATKYSLIKNLQCIKTNSSTEIRVIQIKSEVTNGITDSPQPLHSDITKVDATEVAHTTFFKVAIVTFSFNLSSSNRAERQRSDRGARQNASNLT